MEMSQPPKRLGWVPTRCYPEGGRWELWLRGVTGRVIYVGRVFHNPYDVIEASMSVPTFGNIVRRGGFATLGAAADAVETRWRQYLRHARPVRRAYRRSQKEARLERRKRG